MKKVLLLLMAFVPMGAFAQIDLSAVFDFNHPETLHPAITPSTDYNTGANVSDKVFKEGPITISFSSFTTSGGYVELFTEGNFYMPDKYTYRLRITSGSVMTISCSDRTKIKAIHISEESMMGNLGLKSGEPGKQTSNNWSNNGQEVTSVSFWNTSSESRLDQLTVDYTAPSDVLTATSDLPSNISTPFTTMTLTFSKSVSILDVSGIRLTGSNNVDVAMNCDIPGGSSNVVTLSVDDPIKLDGTYTITVPRKRFQSADGYQNDEMSFTFTLEVKKNNFNIIDVSPKNGTTAETLAFPIVLTFPNDPEGDHIGFVDTEKKLYLWRSGREEPLATVKAVMGENAGEVLLKVVGTDNELSSHTYKTAGTYTLKVDEGTVYNQNYESDLYKRYNPDIKLSYTVVDPLADLKETAAKLKAKIGTAVGYPTAESTAATKLSDVTAEEATPTKETLEEAIAAYYAETNIKMPEVGKWYTIASVADGSQPLYLTYSNSAVSLGSASQAGTFKVSNFNAEDNTVLFETPDGKYLHVLTTSTEYDVSDENATNVTTKKAFSNLKLAKFDIATETDKTKFEGKLSMYGYLGRINPESEPDYAFSMVDHTQQKIVTEAGKELSYEKSGSGAFIFSEVTVDHTKPLVTLSPQSVNIGTTELTLTFSNVKKASMIEEATVKPYFATDEAGANAVTTATATNILTATSSDNQYTAHIDGLTEGTYYLIIPTGVLSYDSGNNFVVIDDSKISRSFTIVVPEPTLSLTYDRYSFNIKSCVGKTPVYVSDVDLNDFLIYAYVPEDYNALVADPTKEVWVVDGLNHKGHRKGHFESYPSFAAEFATKYPTYAGRVAIKLVLDEPFESGELDYSEGDYAFMIPAETFGNKEFGDYLDYKKGKTTTKPDYDKIKTNELLYTSSFTVNNAHINLTNSIEAAITYYNSIKDGNPSIAAELLSAIKSAEDVAGYAFSKGTLDSAKNTLDAALEAAKEAVATGITTISADDDAFNGVSIFTIDGRKLDGKPTKKGVYIVNGRKVVIK